MESFAFKRKTFNTQRPRVDRFIPPREAFEAMQRRMTWSSDNVTHEIWCAKHLYQKKYSSYLDEVFDLELEAKKYDITVDAWPCAPRKKKYLSSADSILDLPMYSFAAFPELLDWSSDNILVAALGNNYHKWSWKTQSLISQGFTRSIIQCCKFDPSGELLAFGTAAKMVEIHNSALSKPMTASCCRCWQLENLLCSITALDWSPTGNSFATFKNAHYKFFRGCSRGVVGSYLRNSLNISSRRVIRGPILSVRISPDTRYVASTYVNGTHVVVLTWPMLKTYTKLETDGVIKVLTWHPWRSALLGIGAVTPTFEAHIAVWDVPASQMRTSALSSKPHSLDAMLFSRRTGELVVSLWNPGKLSSELVVLNGRASVVDQWGEGHSGLDRVRTMVFSPDETKLATATADEDLIIWNFLPEDRKKRKKTQQLKFAALPVYMDKIGNGVSWR